ncbi:hypothetical protein F4677DRAFT_404471 [Hypoxylon crocopeplum]|nr:hypothetical protein F4677DRAFT_404471 [Hypoxylon crocopeplum]
MASVKKPYEFLMADIANAIHSQVGYFIGLKLTREIEESGKIPHGLFWARVDPKELIPRDTIEWEEAQWRTIVPVIYVDFSKVREPPVVEKREDARWIIDVVERVFDEHITIYDDSPDCYPPGIGVDPRRYLVILKPFNIGIGPRVARVTCPPQRPSKSKSQKDLSDRRTVIRFRDLLLDEESDPNRVGFEREWSEWSAKRAAESSSSLANFVLNTTGMAKKAISKEARK